MTHNEHIEKIAEEFDKRFPAFKNRAFTDDTVRVIKDWLRTTLTTLLAQEKKAFGGCEKCYGKGYSTQMLQEEGYEDFGGEGYVKLPKVHMTFCPCGRGAQLEALITSNLQQEPSLPMGVRWHMEKNITTQSISTHNMTHNETKTEEAVFKAIEEHIENMKWVEKPSEYVLTLIHGNVRGVAGRLIPAIDSLLHQEREEMIKIWEEINIRCGKCDGAQDLEHTLACKMRSTAITTIKKRV